MATKVSLQHEMLNDSWLVTESFLFFQHEFNSAQFLLANKKAYRQQTLILIGYKYFYSILYAHTFILYLENDFIIYI